MKNFRNCPIYEYSLYESFNSFFYFKAFFISQYYLSRSFKQVTGFTFIEYLNSVRIREAQRLLRETEKQVIQIAHMVGFNNISHFGRIFKAITKYTPLQYRKIYQ